MTGRNELRHDAASQRRPEGLSILDRFVGPGATNAELAIQFVPTLIAAIAAPIHAANTGAAWAWPLYALTVFLAIDLVGGILTNATSAAKRWYHRASQTAHHHYAFTALHTIHIFLVAWLYRESSGWIDWTFFITATIFLHAAAICIILTPLYLKRPVAMLMLIIGLVIDWYILTPTPALEWFLPLLWLKLLICHLLPERADRPDDSETQMQP